MEKTAPGQIELASFQEPWPQGFFNFARLTQVKSERGPRVPWEIRPWVIDFCAVISSQDAVVIKERKIGWTEAAIRFLLYHALFVPHSRGLFITYAELEAYKSADSAKARMSQVYNALPEWLREASPVINGTPGNFGTMEEVVFSQEWNEDGATEGSILFAPATANIGAAGNYSVAWFDEQPRHVNAAATWEAVSESSRFGRRVAGGSLEQGSSPATFTWQLWKEAASDRIPNMKALFYGFGSRPDDTEEKYNALYHEAEASGSRGLLILRRNHPRTAQEAMSTVTGGFLTPDAAASRDKTPSLIIPPALRRWSEL